MSKTPFECKDAMKMAGLIPAWRSKDAPDELWSPGLTDQGLGAFISSVAVSFFFKWKFHMEISKM